MNARESSGCRLRAPDSKGLRIPSTAEDVFAEIKRPARALAGERKKRFDLESFIKQVYAESAVQATRAGTINSLTRAGRPVAEEKGNSHLSKDNREGNNRNRMNTSSIVQKLWNYCNVLRDDGMSYGDYVEQLTSLLFLKMADERTKAPYNQKSPVLEKYSWPSLIKKDGDELFDHYRHTLEALGNQKGLLGLIFNKSQNKFDSDQPWSSASGRAVRAQIRSRRICQDPAKLWRLIVDLIDKETWVSMSADVKGDAYEGLLEAALFRPWNRGIRTSCPAKYTQDTKSGAGGFLLAA